MRPVKKEDYSIKENGQVQVNRDVRTKRPKLSLLDFTAEAIRTTVVPISGVIGPTVVRIANTTYIGYRHEGSIRLNNKLTYALNYLSVIN